MYVWGYRTIPPNLNPQIVLKTSFGGKPPNLMTANVSGYTVRAEEILTDFNSEVVPPNRQI